MYLSRGKAIAVLTIRRGDLQFDADGLCKSTSSSGRAEDLVDIHIAGPMAEWRAFGNDSDFECFLEEHAGQLDIYEAGELARRYLAQVRTLLASESAETPTGNPESEASTWLVRRCEGVARDLDNIWPAVEAVADALLQRLRLSGEEVARIYREAGGR